jgi:hypothetical protein
MTGQTILLCLVLIYQLPLFGLVEWCSPLFIDTVDIHTCINKDFGEFGFPNRIEQRASLPQVNISTSFDQQLCDFRRLDVTER